jgi:hypothetical protein
MSLPTHSLGKSQMYGEEVSTAKNCICSIGGGGSFGSTTA